MCPAREHKIFGTVTMAAGDGVMLAAERLAALEFPQSATPLGDAADLARDQAIRGCIGVTRGR